MLAVIERQIQAGTQVVLVGDTAQKIYGWNGAVNAFERPNRIASDLTLSHSTLWNSVTGWPMPFLRKPATRYGSKRRVREVNFVAQSKTIARTNAGVVQLAGQLANQGHKVWSLARSMSA